MIGIIYSDIVYVLVGDKPLPDWTYWSLNKMATTLQTTFSNAFLEWKLLSYKLDLLKYVPLGLIDDK